MIIKTINYFSLNPQLVMVLPWVSDKECPPFKPGLLGCPFYDHQMNEMKFAYDKRSRLNIKQSLFRRIGDMPSNLGQYPLSMHPKNRQDFFISKSLIESHKYSTNFKRRPSSLLAFQACSDDGEYILSYPNNLSTGLVIENLIEMELESGRSELCISSRSELSLPFTPVEIKARPDGIIGAFCPDQIVFFYKNLERSNYIINFECFEKPSMTSFDISWTDIEVSILMRDTNSLFIIGDSYRYEFPLSNDFEDCRYCSHPSLIALYGNLDEIEFKDVRGANASFNIKDRNSPFSKVSSLIPHKKDEYLISMACSTDSEPGLKELRIYDVRYPKESTIRVSLEESFENVIYFDSLTDDQTDNILAVDSNMSANRWEFRHSKSNRQFIDGILSLADFEDSKKLNHNENIIDKINYIGCNAATSSKSPNTIFFVKADGKGTLDYCTFSDKFSEFDMYPDNDFVPAISKKINFEHIAVTEDNCTESVYGSIQRNDDTDFSSLSQSTFHLDFYWDELKLKLSQQ